MLEDLANSGDTGSQIVSAFRDLDKRLQDLGGILLWFMDNVAGIAPAANAVVLNSGILSATRHSDKWFEQLGYAGHEFTHLMQPRDLVTSTQGEALAYRAEAQLRRDFYDVYGASYTLDKVRNFALTMDMSSAQDLDEFREILVGGSSCRGPLDCPGLVYGLEPRDWPSLSIARTIMSFFPSRKQTQPPSRRR